MNELELFKKWFENQTTFDIIYSERNFGSQVPLSEVLKYYNAKRVDMLVKHVIAEELIKEEIKEEYALKIVNKIMTKVRKLNTNVKEVKDERL